MCIFDCITSYSQGNSYVLVLITLCILLGMQIGGAAKHVVVRHSFNVKGDRTQSCMWEEIGFRMHILNNSLLSSETSVVTVTADISTHLFEYPEGMEPVSAVYTISFSKPLHRQPRIELQHCVDVNDRSSLSFAVTSHSHRSSYKFYEVTGGTFGRHSCFGVITFRRCTFMTVVQRRLENHSKCTLSIIIIVVFACFFLRWTMSGRNLS